MGVRVALLASFAFCASAQTLPDGPDQDLVQAVCTACHTTERIAAQHKTKAQWQDKVLEMLQEEPDVTQGDRDKIVAYLAKTFPAHVNVNAAAAKEIADVLDLPAESAAALIAYREKNGAFKTIADVKQVPGLDAAKLDAVKDRIEF